MNKIMNRILNSILLTSGLLFTTQVFAQASVSFVNDSWYISSTYDKPHVIALKITQENTLEDVFIFNGENFVEFSWCFRNSSEISEDCVLQAGQYSLVTLQNASELATTLQSNRSRVYLLDYEKSSLTGFKPILRGYNHPLIAFFPAGLGWWYNLGSEFKSGGTFVYP